VRISDILPTRRSIQRLAVAATVAVLTAASIVVVPTVGHASAAACTTKAGRTSNLALGANGPHPTGGTIFTKQPPGCLDFNLIAVGAADHYEGWLFNASTDKWFACSAGFVKAPPVPKVLCSNVATGVQMAVVQESGTQRNVTMEY